MMVYTVVLVVYLGILAAIGVVMSRRSRNAGDFALGGRSVGPWVTALSFVAAYYSSVVIIGGGATGVGTAVDAASRGYAVLLLEQSDFGKGTSSRSTKLVHGGVRYLQQGNVSLVMEALKERGILRHAGASVPVRRSRSVFLRRRRQPGDY